MSTPNQKAKEALNRRVAIKGTTTTPHAELSSPAPSQPPQNESHEDTSLSTYIQRYSGEFLKVIPNHIKPERLIRLAESAIRRSPKLMACDLTSVLGGMLTANSLGLEVNSPLHQASLIPFKNNETHKKEAQLIIEYRGYIDLMLRDTRVANVFGAATREGDKLERSLGTGDNYFIRHTPAGDPDAALTGAYAVANFTNGYFTYVYLTTKQLERIRDKHSKGYQHDPTSSPWITDTESMFVKTAVRQLERWVPKTIDLAVALQADEQTVDPVTIPFDQLNLS